MHCALQCCPQRRCNKQMRLNINDAEIPENDTMGARTEKAGLPARATGTNLLPELRYINKFSAH